jgi:hypothetical protein
MQMMMKNGQMKEMIPTQATAAVMMVETAVETAAVMVEIESERKYEGLNMYGADLYHFHIKSSRFGD